MASVTNRVPLIRTEDSTRLWSTLPDVSVEPFALDALLLTVSLTAWVACRLFWVRRKGSSLAAPTKKNIVSTSSVTEKETPPSDAAMLTHLILQTNDRQRSRALDLYRRSRSKIDWSGMPAEEKSQVFFNLCLAAARLDRTDVLKGMLRDMERLCVPRTEELYTALLKMSTSKRQFPESLSLWQRMHAEKLEVTDRAAWSCLLFSATEVRSDDLALFFFAKLSAVGEASAKDYGNVIRIHASRQAGQDAFALIEEMCSQGLEPDSFAYNASFNACCAGTQNIHLAEQLFVAMKAIDGCIDAVTYNTLVKAYVQAKRLDDCFALVAEMEASDTATTAVTYGTLLDACVNEGRMDRAQEVLSQMAQSGCQMNCVLYTTMIKGFAKCNKVNEALHVFEEMLKAGVEPDMFTFSLVLKVLCDSGKLERALKLFEAMQAEGHQFDPIIFNNLLGGCIVCKNVVLGEKLIEDMIRIKVRPTCATFSTLLKLYAACQELTKAQALIENMEARYGVQPEQRLYLQLVHMCLRSRQWDRGLNVLHAHIARYGAPPEAEIAKMVGGCINFNLLEAAVQFATVIADSGGRVASAQLQTIVDLGARKRKPAIVGAIMNLAQKHKLRVIDKTAA